MAFPGYMSTRLGPFYLRAFLGWFVDAHHAVALAAARGGRVTGYVVGAPDGYGRDATPRTLLPAALSVARRPGLLLDRRIRETARSRIAGLFREPPAAPDPALEVPSMALVGIGVLPEERGRGVGKELVQRFEKEAAARGMRSLSLSVYPDNQSARQLYERCGWEASAEAPAPGHAMFYSKRLAP
jgi:ribosomal protein S18 acetylase RimI-like enzyme